VTGVWGSTVDIGKGVGTMILFRVMKNGTLLGHRAYADRAHP